MKIFKNYKKLYETQTNNNKILNEINVDLRKRNKEYQEKIKALKEKVRLLRENYAKVRIELEDTKGFLDQEKQVSTALRNERANLKRKLTNNSKKKEVKNAHE